MSVRDRMVSFVYLNRSSWISILFWTLKPSKHTVHESIDRTKEREPYRSMNSFRIQLWSRTTALSSSSMLRNLLALVYSIFSNKGHVDRCSTAWWVRPQHYDCSIDLTKSLPYLPDQVILETERERALESAGNIGYVIVSFCAIPAVFAR